MREDLERFRSFTIAHPRLLEAKEELLNAVESSPPGSLIFVAGPTGVGKTTLRRKVEESLAQKMATSIELDPCRIPFVGLEAAAPDNGNFQWRDHFQRMLVQMQEPLIEHKLGVLRNHGERKGDVPFAVWPRAFTGYQLQQSVENALHYRRPAAVFIDEAQHLARMASGRKLADQLDVIKSLASRTQTVHVLIGTYELLAFRNLSGQLSRRSIDLHFLRYRAESADDLEIFRNIVFTFQKQLPFQEGFDLLGIWDFLYERSLGCIGVLKDWLMRALIATSRSSNPALTLAVLEKTSLSGSQCEKMLAEARDGENRFVESKDSRSRLRHLLNLTTDTLSISSDARQTAVPKARKRIRGGQRRPQRDQIGKVQATHA